MNSDGSDSDSSQADVEDDMVCSRHEILDLLETRFRDATCLSLARAIREAETASLPDLQTLIPRVANLGRASCIKKEEWRRGLYLFGLCVLKRLFTHLKNDLLGYVASLAEHVDYWEQQRAQPVWFYLQQGPSHWYQHRPRALLETGVKPWLSRVAYRQHADVMETIRNLHSVRDEFLEHIGGYHYALQYLDGVDNFERDVRSFQLHTVELYNYVCYPRFLDKSMISPDRFLRCLEDIVVHLPEFREGVDKYLGQLRKPHHFRRQWMRYLVLTTGALYGARRVQVNWEQIVQTSLGYYSGLRGFLREHLVAPARSIFGHVFNTFRSRQSSASQQSYQGSRESLARMLEKFGEEHASELANVFDTTTEKFLEELPQRAQDGDMSIVMRVYDTQIDRPIRNVVTGDVAPSLLIQVQKAKVDSESALLQLDQILNANEINFQFLAVIPVFVLLGGTVWLARRFVSRWRTHRENPQLLRAARDIEDVLIRSAPKDKMDKRDVGLLLLNIHQLENHLQARFGSSYTSGRDDILHLLRDDLQELRGASLSTLQKLWIIQRMHRSYPFLHQTHHS